MTAKPIQAHKVKALIDNFSKRSKEIEVYEAKELSLQSLKELTQSSAVWLVREKNKWT